MWSGGSIKQPVLNTGDKIEGAVAKNPEINSARVGVNLIHGH